MQISVREARRQLSWLLELVESGEPVVMARGAPLVPPGDDWWAAMGDEECDAWVEGR